MPCRVEVLRVSPGQPMPDEVGRFVPSVEGAPQPYFIADVFLVVVGECCWALPGPAPGSPTGVVYPCRGAWDLTKHLVSVMFADHWRAPPAPAEVAGISLRAQPVVDPRVTQMRAGARVPEDWLFSYTTECPGGGAGASVEFSFQGDVVVVELDYGFWVLPDGHPQANTGVTPLRLDGGPGVVKAFPSTKDVLWPANVVVLWRDPGGWRGGHDPEPEVGPAPASPVLEPAS